jgi:hypothetical protein
MFVVRNGRRPKRMKLPETLVDPNCRFVTDHYLLAYRCSDSDGYYILDGETHEIIGRGKSPSKAWKHAAELIRKAKKKGTSPRLKSPRKGKHDS